MNSELQYIFGDIQLILAHNHVRISQLYTLTELSEFFKYLQKNAAAIQSEFRHMQTILLRLHSSSCGEWERNKTIFKSRMMIDDTPIQVLVKILDSDIVERLMPNVSSATSDDTMTFNIGTMKDYENICYWSLMGLLKVTSIESKHTHLEFNMVDPNILISELANIYKYRELWKEWLFKDPGVYITKYKQYLTLKVA
jgi:hypothetical protein